MGAITGFIICLVIIIAGFVFASICGKAQFRHETPWWSHLEIPVGVLTALFVIPAIILSIVSFSFVCTAANIDTLQAKNKAQSAVYTTMIEYYEELRSQDVTASDAYMELYEDILTFNKEVGKAQRWGDTWWAEGVFYDPVYIGVEPVELLVG